MARLNVSHKNTLTTHEGASAFPHLKPMQQLRRLVLSCLLWENEFYVDGKTIADQIETCAQMVSPTDLMELAIEARHIHNLRHVPLLLLDVLSMTGPKYTAETTMAVVSRADELSELLAVHWRHGRKCVPRQMRKGLAKAFTKFDEYQLAKYDRDNAVKLRDVLRIARPKPANGAQSALWKRVKDRTLKTPDTWEVALSGGADKKNTFERLISEGNLGYFALLRNLRNMAQAGVDTKMVNAAICARGHGAKNILPFRYVAAARAAPQFEPALDFALREAINELPVYEGKTAILVDVSGSMDWALSDKSDLKRIDAAAALGSIIPGDIRLFTFSDMVVEVPPRRGMAGVDAIVNSQPHQGTQLGAAVTWVNSNVPHDRMIVITDEQSHDHVPTNVKNSYMINVASNQNGVGYGSWKHIDGFSEGVLRFIYEIEKEEV